ncbi:hypothetical protein [Micromonospora sp. WMMD964]|uniref:hypothetical protein n=1 Tax=Micromonospora sp. WMMD964 TaxID=3016091 RepID=UPI00249AEB50|nr:hypothetical protein [Micromonospora sp. WMMD964]WFF01840.1 hypothetical protein O7616_03365 [Micromonospora sp. WMMD964]
MAAGSVSAAAQRPPALAEPTLPEADLPAAGSREPSTTPSPDAQPAGVGIRLLDAPVDRRDDTRAYKYIVDHVKPGTTIKRRVEVRNSSEIHRKVTLYAAAASVSENGFEFAPDRTENELSSWISVSPTEEALAPDEEVEALATITVPSAAEAGERYAVVWAEVPGTDGSDVRSVGRVGIRVYLSVGPGGEPPSGFDVGPLTGGRDAEGTPFVTAEVRNTGRRALDLAGELRLSDGPGGLAAGPVKVEAGTLPLDGRATVRVLLDRRLPDGPWAATLALASGWTKRTATGAVTFGPVPAGASSEDQSRQLLTGGLVASGLVLTFLVVYVYRRRLRTQEPVPAA